jgi:hypothetical protein
MMLWFFLSPVSPANLTEQPLADRYSLFKCVRATTTDLLFERL